MKLTFWGAAGEVTGSMHLVESGGRRFLLDCGLHQGRRKEADRKNRNLPFPGSSIDAVVLSHAHIDHSGNLPTLVKNGFSGPIFSTPATIDLCHWMLRDTAHIHEKDAEFLNQRLEHRKSMGLEDGHVEPLYTMADAERTLPLLQPVPYHSPHILAPGLNYTSYDAGHILGSSFVVLHEASNGSSVRLGFSGDIGRPNLPIIRDPESMPPADYLIMESTYGGRLHKNVGHVVNKLADVVNRTAAARRTHHRAGLRRGPHPAARAPAAPARQREAHPQHPDFRRQPAGVERHRGPPRPPRVLRRRDPRVPVAPRGPFRLRAPAVRPRGWPNRRS